MAFHARYSEIVNNRVDSSVENHTDRVQENSQVQIEQTEIVGHDQVVSEVDPVRDVESDVYPGYYEDCNCGTVFYPTFNQGGELTYWRCYPGVFLSVRSPTESQDSRGSVSGGCLRDVG